MGHEDSRTRRGQNNSHYPVRSGTQLRSLELSYVRSSHNSMLMHLLTSPDDIMTAIMPEEEQDDFAKGFTIVGHVGRLVEVSLDAP